MPALGVPSSVSTDAALGGRPRGTTAGQPIHDPRGGGLDTHNNYIQGTLAFMFWGGLRSVGVAPCMREILEAVEEGPWTVVVLSGKAHAVFGRIPYRTVSNT